LLPSLAQAREQAKSAVCGMHLSEIFKGIHMYTTENNGSLPNFAENYIDISTSSGPPLKLSFWSALILPYVKDARVYQCPSDRYPVWEWMDPERSMDGDNVVPVPEIPGLPQVYPLGRGGITTPIAPVSYIGNCHASAFTSRGGPFPRKITHFKYPTMFPLVGEGNRDGVDPPQQVSRSRCFRFVGHFCQGNRTALQQRYGFRRHMDGSNWLFVDGHVHHLRPQEANLYCDRIEFDSFGSRRRP
jgi:prepilin-type processing-associated H-X9-DG protein